MNTGIFKTFIEKWAIGDQRQPLTTAEVTTLEKGLGASLPLSYRQFLMTVGPVSMSLALLDSIVDQQLDIAGVQDFYDPAQVLWETRAWQPLGLPEDLFAIASDGAGNKFCLPIPETAKGAADDASVWFFDHEEPEAYDTEVPFTEWIAMFANIANTAPPL